jgi:hypothetical protein
VKEHVVLDEVDGFAGEQTEPHPDHPDQPNDLGESEELDSPLRIEVAPNECLSCGGYAEDAGLYCERCREKRSL